MAWLQSILSAVRQREKQATYACLEMLSSIFSFIKPIEEDGSGTEPSIERPSSTLSETPGKTGQPAAPAPAKKTPPKERFTAWLLKQKEPDSFEELLNLIDEAPMSESTKDVLLKYLRKVPKSDELASVVISFHGTDNEVLLRTDYVNALCDIASKGVCVGALVCVRRTGKTMGIVEALISARAKVLGRRDPALFFHEQQLQLPFSQCKSLLAFLSRCGVPMIFDEYASAEGPTGANLCMFIKSFLDDPAYIPIPRRPISVILMGSEHGAIMHSWQKALDGMQHRGAAATPERLPMPPPSLLYAMYKKRTKTTDVAGFLRTYACSGCNLAEAMELGPPTPEELLRRGFQSVTFLAYEVTAVLYRLASGPESLTEQNQAAVHELVQQGFIENRVRGKLGEYDPTDPRLLTLMGLQKGQDMEKIEGEVLELILRHPEVIDWLKAEFGVHGDVDVHYGKLSRGQMKADMDLLLLHQQTDRGWFFSAKRQEKKQALYDSFLKHLNLLPQLGPPEVKTALQSIKEVTLVAFSAIEDSEPFKGTGLEEKFQFKHGDGSTSTAKVGVRRMLLGEILQGVEKRRGWQWKKFRYLKPAEDM